MARPWRAADGWLMYLLGVIAGLMLHKIAVHADGNDCACPVEQTSTSEVNG